MENATPNQQRKRLRENGFILGRKGWVLPKDYNGEHYQISKDFPFTISRKGSYRVLQAILTKEAAQTPADIIKTWPAWKRDIVKGNKEKFVQK